MHSSSWHRSATVTLATQVGTRRCYTHFLAECKRFDILMNVHRHPIGQVGGVPEHILVVAHPVRVADAGRDGRGRGRVLLGGAVDGDGRRSAVHQVDDAAGAAYRVDDGRVAGCMAHLTAVVIVAAAAAVVVKVGQTIIRVPR